MELNKFDVFRRIELNRKTHHQSPTSVEEVEEAEAVVEVVVVVEEQMDCFLLTKLLMLVESVEVLVLVE